MKIDNKTVDSIAYLAKLEFENEAKDEIISDMSRMLEFVNKLNELNTSGVDPLIYMVEETNMLREDSSEISINQKDALKNAPKKDSDYFKVPKVVEKK